MINVTKPFLPPIEEYQELIKGVWERNWLTNNGPLVNELELELKNYLAINHLLFVNNGTIALQLAIKALELQGEVITTPFSYVATTSSLVWEGCTPVFVDIDEETLNINPSLIEDAITDKTTAILATHVYGNPCDIEKIEAVANKYKLKVIYDAAHCFGVKYKNKSIFDFGDISTTSFHATKLFHTIEGGAVFTKQAELLKKLAYMRNFGHDGFENYYGVGINGKNSEFHAAMGLINLKYVPKIIQKRKELVEHYDNVLQGFLGKKPKINSDATWNYAYYPILFPDEEKLLRTVKLLNDHWIYPRRYFYPSLNKLPYVRKTDLPVAGDIASKVLSLPLYHHLSKSEIDLITRIILRVQNN